MNSLCFASLCFALHSLALLCSVILCFANRVCWMCCKMMDEEAVRALLATLQEIDRMKIANTDASVGVLLVVLGEDLPTKK